MTNFLKIPHLFNLPCKISYLFQVPNGRSSQAWVNILLEHRLHSSSYSWPHVLRQQRHILWWLACFPIVSHGFKKINWSIETGPEKRVLFKNNSKYFSSKWKTNLHYWRRWRILHKEWIQGKAASLAVIFGPKSWTKLVVFS